MPGIEVPKEKWSGKVREVTLGATAAEGGTRSRTVTVGGETTLPFLKFEGEIPHPPAIAIEVRDQPPSDWPALLLQAWDGAIQDVAEWAKAAETAGADLVALRFNASDQLSAPYARQVLRRVLSATGLPLIVFGPGQADLDNEVLVAVAEEGKGERLVLGVCEEKNYRTIVAAALAHGHLVDARAPMDVNLSKQLIILIHDMGLPVERIIMDPTTGALGYGIEYGYSVMERLRIAALQGDSMTQLPMLVTPGEEAWRTKEARAAEGVPAAWGDYVTRAINWEVLTASTLIQSGADIVVLRHPESLRRVRAMISALMG
ncbi:MAG: acetyl-CoA decarbonylase/synthase complex subunit delta [Anaerolineae bacterium]|nr:acetyl-CoA decarbonylase/synthase complex subunit delta [Anaerolineae bacterium]MDW8071849.1 acetyl-CoA decarbonylase/synthase complex subunit delta [Anaerolineae bacterium]